MDEHNSEEEQFYNNSPITFDDFKDFSSVNESSDDQTTNHQNQNNQQLNFSPQLNPITEISHRDNIMNHNEDQILNDQNILQQQQLLQNAIDEDMFQQLESNESFQSNQQSFQPGLMVEKQKSQLSSNQVLNEKIQEQLNKIESRQQSQQINWTSNDIFLKKQNSSQRKDFNSNFEGNVEQLTSQESDKQRIEKNIQDSIQKKFLSEIGSQNEVFTSQGIQGRKMSNQEYFQAKNKNEQLNELEQQIQKYQEIQQQIERKRKNSQLKSQQYQSGSETDSQKSIPQQLQQHQIVIEQEKLKQQQISQFERKSQGSYQQTDQYHQLQQPQYNQTQNIKLQQQVQLSQQMLQQQSQQFQQIQLSQIQQQSQLQQQYSQQLQQQQQQQMQKQNQIQLQQLNQQIQQQQSIQQQQTLQQKQFQQQQQQQVQQSQNIQQKQQVQSQKQQQQLQQQNQQQLIQQQQQYQLLLQQQQQQFQKLNQSNYLDENVEQNFQIDKRQIENNELKLKMQWDSVLKDSKVNSEFKKNVGQKSIEKQLKQLENQQNIYKQLIQNQQQHEQNEKHQYSKHMDEFCNAIGYDRSQSQSPQKYEQIKDKLLFQSGNTSGSSKKVNIPQTSQLSGKDLTQKFKENQQIQMHQDGKNENRNQHVITFANHQPIDGGPLQMADINNNSSLFNNITKNNIPTGNSRILNSNQSSNTINQQQQIISNDLLPDRNIIERIDNQFSLSNERQDFNQSNYSQKQQHEENVSAKNSHLLNSNSMFQNSNLVHQQSEQDTSFNLQCPIHPEEQNLFYCISCKQFNVCLVCLHSGLHPNHQVIDIQQEIKNCNNSNMNSYFIHKIVSLATTLKERKNVILGKQDIITQNQKRIMNQQDEIILFVQSRLQEIRMNIDNYEKKIHNDINKVFTHLFEKFCADQDKLQELSDELQNECDFFETAFSQQQNQLTHSSSGNIQTPNIPHPIKMYANYIDKIEGMLQEDNPLSKTIDLNISSLENNNMTESNNLELVNIVESLKNLTAQIQKSINEFDKPQFIENQNAFNSKFKFESIQQPNRSKSPQLDTFRKSPVHSKQQSKASNFLNGKTSALQEQFYNHLYPSNQSPLQKQIDIFNLEHRLDDHFMSQSPTRFEGQNISQHSLSVNSMFGKSANSTSNPNYFQSTTLLAKHNQSQKLQDNLSHRKSLSHRKIDVGFSQVNKNYETLQRIKQNLDQISISPHSSQKKIQLKHTNNLFNHIASSNGINPSNGSLLKKNQNIGNDSLKSKLFSNTSNLSSISNNTSLAQNLKRQNIRNRKSDIDLNNMKSGYEDFKSSNKFFNSLIPSSTQSQLLSPSRIARADNPQVSHRNHPNQLQKNIPITIDQQYSCSKMMSNLIKYKQLYNKGKRSFFDQSSNAESSTSNNFT